MYRNSILNTLLTFFLDYVKLSMFTMGGMYMTNASLMYLNYPSRIVFKSSKVIPVMIAGVFIQKRYYTRLEYLSAVILVTGIVIFTLGMVLRR